ncbi:unnamed protein product [Urochloa humidicola]
MADLAVGLSRTAVQLLADKVKSAIKEEAEKWQIVERDLVFITGEFEIRPEVPPGMPAAPGLTAVQRQRGEEMGED